MLPSMTADRKFISLRVGVLTISDTRTLATDGSGQVLVDELTGAGHRVHAREIVRDDIASIREQFAAWIADDEIDVVLSTGGTGVTRRDVTPEALAPLVTKPIPGFGELFRMVSFDEIGTSTIQSRAEAALCDDTFVFILPGSPGACRTAMRKILLSQLDHRHRPCNFVELLPRIRHGERPLAD
ncbi:MAG: molybdenum cofactor biosynthesis protein B [Myxococcales bacterium FL481]|nr:MAG: molybdenum cofactor biosynthesis protein B [Myxococcales bacterium FL481]